MKNVEQAKSGPHTAPMNPFWPLLLLNTGFLVFLAWQVVLATRQWVAAERMSAQQEQIQAQAVDAEARLQALMTDLLVLARTDETARSITKRYSIRYTPTSPSPAPASKPAAPADQK